MLGRQLQSTIRECITALGGLPTIDLYQWLESVICTLHMTALDDYGSPGCAESKVAMIAIQDDCQLDIYNLIMDCDKHIVIVLL